MLFPESMLYINIEYYICGILDMVYILAQHFQTRQKVPVFTCRKFDKAKSPINNRL